MQPAPHVVAGRPSAGEDLVVAAAAAEIARPAPVAGLLAVHVAPGEPRRLAVRVDPVAERPHRARGVADEAVAGGEGAVGGDTEIARPGAAGIGPVRAAADLAERGEQVGKAVALARHRPALEFGAAVDHGVEHGLEVVGAHLVAPGRCCEHRREADAVEAGVEKAVERLAEAEVARRDGHPRRHLHPPLAREQRRDPPHDRVVAAPAAAERPQRVVDGTRAVEADRDREAVLFEEVDVRLGDEGAVGGDREAEHHPALAGRLGGVAGRRLQHRPVGQRLAAEEGEVQLRARRRLPDEKIDGGERGGLCHRRRRRAEASLLRIAVAAPEVALLRHRQRQRVEGRVLQRDVVDRRTPREPRRREEGVETSAGDRRVERIAEGRVDVEELAAVGEEEVSRLPRRDHVRLRHARRRCLHAAPCRARAHWPSPSTSRPPT